MNGIEPGRWVTAGNAGCRGTFWVRAVRTEKRVGPVVDCWGGTKNHRAYRTFRAGLVRQARRPDWARELNIGSEP